MPGSASTLELVSEITRVYPDPRFARRINHVAGRSEDEIDSFPRADLEVGVESPRIAAEILTGAKLQRVHEDRHKYPAVGTNPITRRLHQGRVTRMQRPHSHDDRNLATPLSEQAKTGVEELVTRAGH